MVRGYFDDRDSLEPVSRLEFMDRLKAGLVTVLDVRPEDEFALAICPERSTSRSANSKSGWRTSTRIRKSLPTAAVRIASCHTKQWRCSEPVASRSVAWRTGCRSGGPPVCRWRSVQIRASSEAPNKGAPGKPTSKLAAKSTLKVPL